MTQARFKIEDLRAPVVRVRGAGKEIKPITLDGLKKCNKTIDQAIENNDLLEKENCISHINIKLKEFDFTTAKSITIEFPTEELRDFVYGRFYSKSDIAVVKSNYDSKHTIEFKPFDKKEYFK